MPKKKSTPKIKKQPPSDTRSAALTKKELIDYIGPVFEDLKVEITSVRTGLRAELTKHIDDKTHRLEVLMDATKREIMSALETCSAVSAKEEVVSEHGERIATLETEVRSVKLAIKER
jgi:hypothetical protein